MLKGKSPYGNWHSMLRDEDPTTIRICGTNLGRLSQIFIRRNREHPGKKYEDPRTPKGHTRLVEGKKR